MIVVINDDIIATYDDNVSIMNGELKTVTRFKYKTDCKYNPVSIAGNEEYIAMGYKEGFVRFFTRKSKAKKQAMVRK